MSDETEVLVLTLPPQDEADLVWLFGQAESDLGLKSNLGPQLDRLRISSGRNKGTKGGRMVSSGASQETQLMITAAERYRKVSAVVSRLSIPQQRVLRAYYGLSDIVSAEQRKRYAAYGSMLGVVLTLYSGDSIAGRPKLDSDNIDRLRDGSAGVDARKRIESRIEAARTALASAAKAYRVAKRAIKGESNQGGGSSPAKSGRG